MQIINKKAQYEYSVSDRLTAGVVLTGGEVKSLRTGHGKLEGAFVKVIGEEMYLVNAEIMPYPYAALGNYDAKRTRKLLIHKKELISLQTKLDADRLTLVPLRWYTIGPYIKLEIGLVRGKREYEKREKKKRADIQRELEREYRGKIK